LIEEKADLWLVYEVCGVPLTKLLFSVNGEFYKGERIYNSQQDEKVYEILEKDDCK
jgi:hypothetical protein